MSKKSSKQTRSNRRHSQVETLEAREVMSADPLGGLLGGAISHHSIQEDAQPLTQHGSATLTQPGGVDYSHRADPNADFWLDEQPHVSLEEQLEQIEKSLSSAHQLTGMDDVKANYGFSGIGQTVAVIDSGIAYDHYALGGGLGSNYRVVGGYDFTESDSDPYDDGTEGSHGTHVAGIVGANDGDRSGVAPGVDLVGLRVFSDNGAGYFSWVESALQWVHDNRNAFENPITAVNLSLGTSWNANTIPAWAMLENEFAQLEADGIFISVSAGNSYTTYNEPGLSYPAASPYVVPVMSSDDSGFLSYFSQRHERAIAAPGRYIYSTVPDYAGNNNGVTDDWANFSGTSMAAPYVAGASVIIREAMEFVGMTGITQDSIYDHMIATADSFTDSATGAVYNRLNVQAAIDALMPEDDFGSSVADAYNLGTINAGPQANAGPMSGHIERLNDADYFTFTAGATGTVTFAAQNTTHQLAASWDGMGADGWSSDGGASYTLNVVAGQQYTVALSSSDGLGYYDLSFSAESTFTYTDWGATGVQETKSGINIAGDTFYRIQAGRDGYITVEALQAAGITGIELLDSNLLAVGSAANGRADYYAQAGEELYLKVSGTATGVSFRLTNAVSVSGSTVTMQGTDGADILRSYAGQQTHRLSLNGVLYAFSASSHTNLEINGAGGIDTIVAYGSSQNETALLGVGSGSVRSSTYTLTVSRTESIVVIGGGGFDTAFLYGSGGADKYRSYGDRAVMEGQGYYNRADLYDISYGFANGADDIAYMYGSDGDDQYRSYSDRAVMSGSGYYNRAIGFASTWGYGDSPGDVAWMYGSAGDDEYRTSSTHSLMTGDGFSNCAVYFEQTVGWADSAGDQAWMYGSSGADVFSAYSDRVEVTGAGFSTIARNFARTYEFANHSGDVANLYGTAGADQVRAYEDRTLIAGSGYYSRAIGFTTTNVFGGGGADVVHLEDGLGDDAVAAEAWGAYLEYASGVRVEVRDCESIIARGVNGGVNTVDENPVDYYFEKIGDWI